MNEQREVIYAERRKVLDGDNMRDVILKMVTDIVENAVDLSITDEQMPEEWDLGELNTLLLPIGPILSLIHSRDGGGSGRTRSYSCEGTHGPSE